MLLTLSGIFSNFSSVKVLLKNWFNVSAFSLGVVASVPSGFFSDGILLLLFVNFLGVLLMLCAISFSKSLLNYLVNDRNLFFCFDIPSPIICTP